MRTITRRPPSSGFTLVELLVVIGIIAVLISILLPALTRVRAQAVSVQCMSNLRQIGTAAQFYINENKGQYPIDGTGINSGANSNLFRFQEWQTYGSPPVTMAATDPRRFTIRDAMLKYCKGNAQVFFCPSNDLPALATLPRPYGVEDFLSDGSNANLFPGRFTYWWVANPVFFPNLFGSTTTQDESAAKSYWHQDVMPPVKDTTRPCKPGIDYLRSTKDKNIAKVPICVDQSRQANATNGIDFWYFMHGSSQKRGWWKNELFGDGHCEQKRPDEVFKRWGAVGGEAAW
jgi:prepilin-type N-terminal cleavage/methylation domain-containing protein